MTYKYHNTRVYNPEFYTFSKTAEELKAGCSGVENKWKWVWSEAEEWGKLLEAVLPEMEKNSSQSLFEINHNKV